LFPRVPTMRGCTRLDYKYFVDGEDEARSALDHIDDCIRVALSPENSEVITPENKKELERALKILRPSFDELAKWFIDPMRETKPDVANYGYEKLYGLLWATFVGGSRGTVTDSGKNFLVRKPASDGGKKGGITHRKRAEVWHVEARDHLPGVEKNNPGLSPRKLAPFVISLCFTKIGVEAMTKFIRKEREARK
jgi:hypothetical protein